MAAKDQVGDQDVNINKFAGISDYQDNKQPGPLHPRRIVGCMHEALGNVDLLLIFVVYAFLKKKREADFFVIFIFKHRDIELPETRFHT